MIVLVMMGFLFLYLTEIIPLFQLMQMECIAAILICVPVFAMTIRLATSRSIKIFESKAPGMISECIRGRENENQWSELWYIFKPQNFNKTMAEFSEEDFIEYHRLEEMTCTKKFGDWYELQDK